MPIRDVDVRLRLLNSRVFVREMRTAGAELKAIGGQGFKTAAGLNAAGGAMRRAGGTMTRHLTLPVVGATVALSKYAMDFHQQMTLIQTQAGASGKEVKYMTGHVIALSKQFGIAPTTIAKALFHIESVGLHGPKALDALTNSVKGSVVGLADLESVSSTLAGTWLAKIGGSGRQFHDVMAELNATVGAGNIRMNDLVTAIGTGILPVAKEAHLRLRDVTGALAVMTDEGMPANMAMRLLRTSLNFVVAPTNKATKALGSIGLGQASMARDIRKPQGLLTALADLGTHLDRLPGGRRGIKAGQVLRDLFPAGRGVPLHILLNQLDRYGMKMNQLGKIHGRFDKSVKQQLETPAQRWRIMMNNLRIAALQMGDALMPITMALGTAVAFLADKLSKLPPGARHALVIFVAVAAAIGPVTYMLGAMISGFVRAYQGTRYVVRGLQAIYAWSNRTAIANFFSGWTKVQGRGAGGRLLPLTWKNNLVRRMGGWGTAAGVAFRIAFVAAAIIAIGELDTKFNRTVKRWRSYKAPGGKGGFFDSLIPDHLLPQVKRGQGLVGKALDILDPRKRRRGPVDVVPAGRRGWGGTISNAGRYLVGERGPEQISLPPGARVQPLTPTLAAAFTAAQGGGGSTHFHLYIDGKEVNNVVTRVEKRKANRK